MFKVLKWKYHDAISGLPEYTVSEFDDDSEYLVSEFTQEAGSFPTSEEAHAEANRLNELSGPPFLGDDGGVASESPAT